jgi:uncharacterized protein (TIGR00299 family) protein
VTRKHHHAHAHDDHQHEHEHDHDHEHDHAHEHEHGVDPEAHRAALQSGAGEGKLLFLDAFSGIAGDMTIAALVDLGVPFRVVRDAVACLPLAGYRLELLRSRAGAIGATHFVVHVAPSDEERTYASIDAMLCESALDGAVKVLARRIFRRLAEAEAEVHRTAVADVHFHEVGALDAIVDIVGAAACITHLGAHVVSAPLPMGRGFVHSRHGVLPLPPPATVACLKGVPTYDAGIDVELVTPTGAAIAATVAQSFERWPRFAPLRVGWGRGTLELADRPNALRVVLGDPAYEQNSEELARHIVIEANVDDMTGELAGHALEALLQAGALDAWATPVTMKKGRPGLLVAAVARREQASAVAEALLRETTSIGVRHYAVDRTERPRRVIEVDTRYGTLPVKVSEGPYGPPQMKPEFSACAEAARRAGVPVREVVGEALRAARAKLVSPADRA